MLTVKDVFKSYKKKPVLTDISFSLQQGTVYGLVGKNGVGKSTLLELLLTIQQPDKGEIRWNDRIVTVNNREFRKKLGAAGAFSQMIEGVNIREYLWLVGSLYGLSRQLVDRRSTELIDFFYRHDKDLDKPIRNFSSGMKRKAMLCAAFLHSPDILILDEPFTFLDPASSARLCDLVNRYRQMDKIIIISSHDLHYLDQVATHIGVLNDTRLVFNDSYGVFSAQEGLLANNTVLKAAMDFGHENIEEVVQSLSEFKFA